MELHDATLGDIAERLHELLNLDRATTSGDELLKAAHDWEAAGRATDAARVWVAAQIENESRRELETTGLAYRHGFPTAKKLIAATANVSERTAGTRMHLGRQLRSSVSITGLPLPSSFPAVEHAVFAGRIGVDAAAMICRTLTEVVPRTGWSEAVDEAERHLVRAATATIGDSDEAAGTESDPDANSDADAEADGTATEAEADVSAGLADLPHRYTVDELGKLATRIREHLDPDGAEPRDAVKQALRGFSHPKVGADGIARGRYAFPPYQLGVFLTAVGSILSPRTPEPALPPVDRGSTSDTEHGDPMNSSGSSGTGGDSSNSDIGNCESNPADSTEPDYVLPDVRTSEQKLLDAVMTLIEMAVASPAAPTLNGSAPTVNVHVTLKDLEEGRGAGWIDGSTEPIPMSTINRLRCHGDTLVTLFGDNGEVLRQGKKQRLATPRQRRALAARDGGCVIPGCSVAPSRCQAHHVTPWVSKTFAPGRTDIDNLALLCPFHHATIHSSAWTLVMIHGTPHVRPPDWHDPTRTPIPVGQQRTGRPYFH
jgi:hypothetical protein